jgi:hypothetical protein
MSLRHLELADIPDRSDKADSDAVFEIHFAFCRAPSLDSVVETDSAVFNVVIVRSLKFQRIETSLLRRFAIKGMQTGDKYLKGNRLSRRKAK